MGTFVDLTGKRFGRYTVIERADSVSYFDGKRTRTRTAWKCVCDCGNVKTVLANSLVGGHVVSCGCYKSDLKRAQLTTHGGTVGGKPTRLYKVWDGMKARCYNPRKTYYPIYGGRGITVCDEWRYSFEAFRKWAYANGYDETMTIDRIDNNGSYCPENCRWATTSEQNNNKSTNRFLTYNGETKTIMQWANETGFTFHTIFARLAKGMTVEEALLTPRQIKGNGHFEYIPSKLTKENENKKGIA